MKYGSLSKNCCYIDKTEVLETLIADFQNIYIEGSATTGKTTMVKMFLEKHAELEVHVFDMVQEQRDTVSFQQSLAEVKKISENVHLWIIFENLHIIQDSEILSEIADFLQHLKEGHHGICISREAVPQSFLVLLWNRHMEEITMEDLLFSEEEVELLLERSGSRMHPEEVYAVTGGWAGCIDMMLRLSGKNTGNPWQTDFRQIQAETLKENYEIRTYIQKVILGSLSAEEMELMRQSEICPWITPALCHQVWETSAERVLFERLTRKGFLIHDERKKRWVTAPLFRNLYETGNADRQSWTRLGKWYEDHDYIKEALQFYRKEENDASYKMCMLQYYDRIPFRGISYESVMEWKENIPELIYLRGMYCYEKKDFKNLKKELNRLSGKDTESLEKAEKDPERWLRRQEILLNLQFMDQQLHLDEWLNKLNEFHEKTKKNIRLYHILGNSHTCLCGLRDLTGLFACAKKEENRKARIWKECLGSSEWKFYCMARMDYYLETERKNAVLQEDLELLEKEENLAAFYLMLKWQKKTMQEKQMPEMKIQIEHLEAILKQGENPVIVQNAKALRNLYSIWNGQPERLIRWLRYSEDTKFEITEENYVLAGSLTKGYMLFHQYEKAKKILQALIPYAKEYHRGYLLAEYLFQMAIIRWEENHHGQALQNTIESFLISRQSRYVGFYADYGKTGIEVLEAYVQWMQANSPDGWHRKKKYQYGNVLRMPEADYVGVILRCLKKYSRRNPSLQKESREEQLTMMETIILQDIGRGLTNAEICEDLNLKLPTVKTHIYSLYKKLGVGTRVQAILKGKELGLLD